MTLLLASALALAVAALSAAALGSQLWIAGKDEQSGIGPWSNPKRNEPAVKLPADYVSLRWGEKHGFSRSANELKLLGAKLDEIETELSAVPVSSAVPSSFSYQWLEQRVERIEALAGPLPPVPTADGRSKSNNQSKDLGL